MNSGYLIFSFAGCELTAAEIDILAHPKLGGILLFSENFVSPLQLRQWIEQLRQLRRQYQPQAPQLLMLVDQEGGAIQRFQQGFTRLPAPVLYGGLADWLGIDFAQQVAYRNGYCMAHQLQSCGVDISLAPSLDAAIPGSDIISALGRGMHQDRQMVAKLAVGFARGMQAAGMPATGKHFPNHGFCHADSHLMLPVDTRSCEEILLDLIPYQQLMDEDLLQLVMPAHIYFPQWVGQTPIPGGFTKAIVQDLLRQQLGFSNVVISDCLSMGAVTGTPVDRVCQALTAGQDMVIYSHQSVAVMQQLLNDCPSPTPVSQQRIDALTQWCRMHQPTVAPSLLNFEEVKILWELPSLQQKVMQAVQGFAQIATYVEQRWRQKQWAMDQVDPITGQPTLWPVMITGDPQQTVFDLTTLLALPVDEVGVRHHPLEYQQASYQFTLDQLQLR